MEYSINFLLVSRMNKIAIIDMGTNTFHLLIAGIHDQKYEILQREHEPVKIGLGGINEGIITDSACQRALAAMKRFRTIIDRHGITRAIAFGTSAIRNAHNGSALATEITTATGIPIAIISGEEEAQWIYEGIKAALNLGAEKSLIMDIGAGSVEFIIGNADGPGWKQSFEIGGQRLLEKFQHHDPIAPEEIAALDKYFHQTLQSLKIALKNEQPRVLVGSSGSFDTLSEIYCIHRGIAIAPGAAETPLTIDGFFEIYDELITKNRKERMSIPGMIELRVDMIVVASCLIRFVLEQHSFTGMRVSSYSLKEGVLAKLAKDPSNSTSTPANL